MGKGIIFVGSTNLNRNYQQQSMYTNSNPLKERNESSKDKFYSELRNSCLNFPGKKSRKKSIKKFKDKYNGLACSEKNIERVYQAYATCYKDCKTKKERKAKKNDLIFFFKKYSVDLRVQKRLLKIEGIKIRDNKKRKKQTKQVPKRSVIVKKSFSEKNYYENLHNYLDIFYNLEKVKMNNELTKEFNKRGGGKEELDLLKKLYEYKYSLNNS